jgi:ATP synthase protein I
VAGEKNKKYLPLRQIGLATSIPMMLAAGPIAGYFLGEFIDRKFHSSPWFMILLSLFGFAAGVRQAVLIIIKASKENNNKN